MTLVRIIIVSLMGAITISLTSLIRGRKRFRNYGMAEIPFEDKWQFWRMTYADTAIILRLAVLVVVAVAYITRLMPPKWWDPILFLAVGPLVSHYLEETL